MSKSTRNSRKRWSASDNAALRELARRNTPTRVIGLKLGRTPEAVYTHASQLSISVKPASQRPNKGQR